MAILFCGSFRQRPWPPKIANYHLKNRFCFIFVVAPQARNCKLPFDNWRRSLGRAADISTPAVNLLNENPSLVALGSSPVRTRERTKESPDNLGLIAIQLLPSCAIHTLFTALRAPDPTVPSVAFFFATEGRTIDISIGRRVPAPSGSRGRRD